MNLKAFYVSWVDLLMVVVLLWGIHRGRKRGMSEEVLVLVQWLTILTVGGLGYAPVGQLLAATGFISTLWAQVSGYLLLALLVKLGFNGLRKSLGEKLVASEAFGRGEYYLGMVAGGVRYMCVMVLFLSLLHAREYTRADRAESQKFQEANFGSVLFPTLIDVQDEVFTRSWSGRLTSEYIPIVLIRPTEKSTASIRDNRPINARERAVQDPINNR